MALRTLSIHPVIPAIFKPESRAVSLSSFRELGFRLNDRRNDDQWRPGQGHMLKLTAMRLRVNDESVVPGDKMRLDRQFFRVVSVGCCPLAMHP
jgi:hypothetical protein